MCSDAALSMGASEKNSKIEAFYCNRVYLEGLIWAQQNNSACIFLHIPVLGSTESNYQEVMKHLVGFKEALKL